MTKKDKLKNKKIAIVALGGTFYDYILSRTRSEKYDEVWAINAMIGVLPNIDRAFILDPMSRFLDTEDAGTMTSMMRNKLPLVDYPIYSCELDERVPAVEEYPLRQIVEYSKSAYLNNTVAYAIAYALWSKVKQISIFGVDFTYQTNMHFAEAGRGCVEFWIGKCINQGIKVGIAPRSSLLDTDVDTKNKLYGYHRLDNPQVTFQDNYGNINVCKWSDMQQTEIKKPIGIIGREDLKPVEPKKY